MAVHRSIVAGEAENMLKSFASIVLTFVVALGLTNAAWAIKPFNDAWNAHYLAQGKHEDLKALSEEAKCNVCHIKGENKKKHNPYGESLAKLLKKDDYKKERLEKEPEKVKEELEAAFKKVEGEKAADGKTFKERMAAGKLPGGNADGKAE